MAIENFLLIAGLVTAVLGSRVILLAARGGAFHEIVARQSTVSSILGALTLPAQIVLIIMGFFYFVWWHWALIVLICLFFVGAMVGRTSWGAFASIRPLLDLCSVGTAATVLAAYFDIIQL
ncbi:MAG: hypothetical protein ACT4OK_21985 [Gemmobacter sp.]